jgi:hypothetical protein
MAISHLEALVGVCSDRTRGIASSVVGRLLVVSLGPGEAAEARRTLLGVFLERRHRVNTFLELGVQLGDGTVAVPRAGLPRGGQPVGVIRFFQVGAGDEDDEVIDIGAARAAGEAARAVREVAVRSFARGALQRSAWQDRLANPIYLGRSLYQSPTPSSSPMATRVHLFGALTGAGDDEDDDAAAAAGGGDGGGREAGKRRTCVPTLAVPLCGRVIRSVAFSRDGRHGTALSENSEMVVWGEPLRRDRLGSLAGQFALNDALRGQGIVEVVLGDAFLLARSSKGTVYACGIGPVGQLGLEGGETDTPLPLPIRGLHAVAVAAASTHCAAVTHDGLVMVWGSRGAWSSPTPVAAPGLAQRDRPILAVACGDSHTVALTCSGGLALWEGGSPLRVVHTAADGTRPVFRMVACGAESTFAITEDGGEVYVFGRSRHGQLGLGPEIEAAEAPTKVSGLAGVTQLAASRTHCVALVAGGDVFTWGEASRGLGHPDGSTRLWAPARVDYFTQRGIKAKSIAAGLGVTAVLSPHAHPHNPVSSSSSTLSSSSSLLLPASLPPPTASIPEDDIPPSFLCPITCDVMKDPHVAQDGHSYELVAIRAWLGDHNISPMTGAVLPSKELLPNRALKAQIHHFLAEMAKQGKL